MTDVLFINPPTGDNYQSLKSEFAAIEPPTWSLLLAQSMRSFGFKVSLIDVNAEKINEIEVFRRISHIKPRLISFVRLGYSVDIHFMQ